MRRRFQFTLREMFWQMGLIAMAITCLMSIGEHAGPFWSAFFLEVAAATTAAATGILFARAWKFATIGAVLAMPFAGAAYVLIEGMGV